MEDENEPIVLIDIGTRNCKAGLCGDTKPNIIIPTCLGKTNYNFYTTEDVEYDPTIEEIINPIEHGTIKDFECFNIIINKIFEMLGIEPEGQNLVLTEPSLNSIKNRQDLFGYMFETFKIENLFIANQALLSLYSTGKFTGIVVESGAGVTQIAPIFNTRVSSYAVNRIDFGGNELSEYLNRLLSEKNKHFEKKKYLKFLEQIKKEACYVENKYKKHLGEVEPYEFKLPDGNSITIKTERTTVPEAIFRPDLLGKDWDGIHDLFFNSIEKIKEEEQKPLYENIIVSGGNTMFPGFEKKLEKKIKKKFGNNKNARFIHVEDKMNAAWIGGSSFCYTLNIDNDFVSKSDYEELGFNNCIKRIDSIQTYVSTI